MNILKFILHSIILFLTVNLQAQITIDGTITDSELNPISNALVEIIDQYDTTNYYSAATDASGYFSISNIFTDLAERKNIVPSDFIILRNYPNPFNPSTIIYYELPKSENIEIKIYDILGREVRALFDNFQKAGIYTLNWDGRNNWNSSVAAGVYFCRLKTMLEVCRRCDRSRGGERGRERRGGRTDGRLAIGGHSLLDPELAPTVADQFEAVRAVGPIVDLLEPAAPRAHPRQRSPGRLHGPALRAGRRPAPGGPARLPRRRQPGCDGLHDRTCAAPRTASPAAGAPRWSPSSPRSRSTPTIPRSAIPTSPSAPHTTLPRRPRPASYPRVELRRPTRSRGVAGWCRRPCLAASCSSTPIRRLVELGVVVICCGGGGIPVPADDTRELGGLEAVIDKDRVSAMLAVHLGASVLAITTSSRRRLREPRNGAAPLPTPTRRRGGPNPAGPRTLPAGQHGTQDRGGARATST